MWQVLLLSLIHIYVHFRLFPEYLGLPSPKCNRLAGSGTCRLLSIVPVSYTHLVEHPNVITPKESDVTIEGNVLNVEMAPKTFVLYKVVKASKDVYKRQVPYHP